MPPKTNAVEQKLDQVLEALNKLTETLAKPITSQTPADEPRPRLLPNTNEQGKAPTPEPSYPIPAEFRQQVDSILNAQFGIEIEGTGDPMSMLFTIVVPDKYSNMTASQREIAERDIRPKVIDRAMGVNGVKEWVDTVYKNFSPETQSQITADRIK